MATEDRGSGGTTLAGGVGTDGPPEAGIQVVLSCGEGDVQPVLIATFRRMLSDLSLSFCTQPDGRDLTDQDHIIWFGCDLPILTVLSATSTGYEEVGEMCVLDDYAWNRWHLERFWDGRPPGSTAMVLPNHEPYRSDADDERRTTEPAKMAEVGSLWDLETKVFETCRERATDGCTPILIANDFPPESAVGHPGDRSTPIVGGSRSRTDLWAFIASDCLGRFAWEDGEA